MFSGCPSVRPVSVNQISQECFDGISSKHQLGVKDELIIFWWSEFKVTVTSHKNMHKG